MFSAWGRANFQNICMYFNRVSQPLFLRWLIQSLTDEEKKNTSEPYYYAAGVCIATTLHSIILHPTVFSQVHLGMKCRVATSALIYKKVTNQNSTTTYAYGIVNLCHALNKGVAAQQGISRGCERRKTSQSSVK
jgi:hypothetical protein